MWQESPEINSTHIQSADLPEVCQEYTMRKGPSLLQMALGNCMSTCKEWIGL